MFVAEVGMAMARREFGKKAAIEFGGDIHEYTELYGPNEFAGIPYLNDRELFDLNEHFIEIGGPVQGRTFDFLILAVLVLAVSAPFVALVALSLSDSGLELTDWAIGGCLMLLGGIGFTVYWYTYLRGIFLTALTARYRFNRTIGKVYVLRPKAFGGNVVLDWHRVKAHPNWCAPHDLKPGFQHDPALRAKRQGVAGGHFGRKGLVLYWPPLDAKDPERKGEDIIWVGQWLQGKNLWAYVRVFMEEGMDAVPAPEEDEWRRKGRSSMWQHLWESQLDPVLRAAKLKGNPDPRSAVDLADYLMELPFLPLNTLAQWLCYWPTFPEEWNSDCGQKRRESGIGPEEPLRWVAKV